jgi:hypothetical protein
MDHIRWGCQDFLQILIGRAKKNMPVLVQHSIWRQAVPSLQSIWPEKSLGAWCVGGRGLFWFRDESSGGRPSPSQQSSFKKFAWCRNWKNVASRKVFQLHWTPLLLRFLERLCCLFSSVEPNLEVEIIARPNFVWDGNGITSSEFGEKMVLSKVHTKLKFKCLIDPQRCSKHWISQHSLVHLYYKLTKSKNK